MIDWKRIAARWASSGSATSTDIDLATVPSDPTSEVAQKPDAPATAISTMSNAPLADAQVASGLPADSLHLVVHPTPLDNNDDEGALVESARALPPTAPAETEPEENRLNEVSLADLVRAGDASVRLTNILSLTELFDRHTVADFLEGRLTEAAILRLPNLGRKTYRELRGLAVDYAAALQRGEDFLTDEPDPEPVPPAPPEIPDRITGLTVADLADDEGFPVRIANRLSSEPALRDFPLSDIFLDPDEAGRRLRAIDSIGRKSINELIALVVRIAAESPASPLDGELPSDGQPPREGMLAAMAALPEKQQFVLTARYGLDGTPPRTLEEVGTEVFVTRERVRQVQKKAVEALGRRAALKHFAAFLADKQAEAWSALAADSGFVSSADTTTRTPPFEPLLALAVDVVHGETSKWLDSFAVVTQGGWLPPGASADGMRADVLRLQKAIANQPLPRPVDDVAADADMTLSAVSAALPFISSARIHEGYLHSGYFGSKTRRAARLHRLAIAEGAVVTDVWRLHELDTDASHEDERSARMVFMQMDENPHLFAPLYDHYWLVLPTTEEWSTAAPVLRAPALEALDPGFEENSLSRWLWRRLHEVGPMRMSDLRDEALAAMPEISGSSIGAILQTNPVFHRVAPGVFDIRIVRSGGVKPALLSNFQGRAYARALRCGAGRQYFSAWTAEFEWRLCEWARWQADPDVFRSLLEVCDPTTWPVADEVREEWQELRDVHGHWLLASERRSILGVQPPTGMEFIAGLAHLAAFGSIGWIGADRVMQNRLGSNGAADLLALLVACGAAEAPEDWQTAHIATPFAMELINSLSATLYREGKLDWSRAPLLPLLALAATEAARVTWATPSEVVALTAMMSSGEATVGAALPVTALAEAEELFESDEWDSLFKD